MAPITIAIPMNSGPEARFFETYSTIRIGDRLIDLQTPKIMGILNVTPDSFFDGGRYETESAMLDHVELMLREGATFIDVGAYSSRPGAADIPPDEERSKALFAVRKIAASFPEAVISIDTFRSEVARACVDTGAHMVNDISAGELDPHMPDVVASLGVPYIAMHMRGTPQTMKSLTQYDDLLKEIVDYFHRKLALFNSKGIKDIILDPGFGFAKTIDQNFKLLNNFDYLRVCGRPILAGLSRKSMIWRTLNQSAADALNGTTALNSIALTKGASILRVHDVAKANEVIQLFTAMRNAAAGD
ncbi:dihydropteroate synthase [Chryseolinea sp. T2]|uniref:dihydropteroate synthase n=1 Tax=Chryseolinea sp. T2 TaxID=3129255 RepID=UPI003076ACEB